MHVAVGTIKLPVHRERQRTMFCFSQIGELITTKSFYRRFHPHSGTIISKTSVLTSFCNRCWKFFPTL